MSEPFQHFIELQDLMNALCDEAITPEQVQRLEELVLSHPDAEKYYIQTMSLHAELITHFGVLPAGRLAPQLSEGTSGPSLDQKPAPAEQSSPGDQRRRVQNRNRILLWGGIGISALAAAVLAVLTYPPRPQNPTVVSLQEPETNDDTVAVLLQSADAVWDEEGPPKRAGTPLAPGWLRLKSGIAHIEFYSGATVILEAPADLQLISRMEAYCYRGKLRATVPSYAQGFTIGTPSLRIVDQGTEFGVQIDDGNKAEVHVFQGKVDVYDAKAQQDGLSPRELTTGQGVRLNDPNGVQSIVSVAKSFRTARELAERSEKEIQRQHEAWEESSEIIRKDPGLVLYYPFQRQRSWSRTLHDQSRGREQPHDGAIVGCSWVTGRWPGKLGLEFKRVSDRVRVDVPGTFDSLTLMAWVRVDALSPLNNSLFMADGWPEGGVHWQVGEAGKLVLGIKAPKGTPNGHYHAYDILRPERLGQWLHLAVVYDRDDGHVTHYVDGEPASRSPILFDVPLRIGNAEIGNWNYASFNVSQPIRSFSGCMDEFLFLSRALSQSEIEQHYNPSIPSGTATSVESKCQD